MSKYFCICRKLQLGEYEKNNITVLPGEDEEEVCRRALENECHNKPTFDEDGCWDDGWCYSIASVREISKEDYEAYLRITGRCA